MPSPYVNKYYSHPVVKDNSTETVNQILFFFHCINVRITAANSALDACATTNHKFI